MDGANTLQPGVYKFSFEIPSNTLSNGEYKIVFDVAQRCVKNYADESSILTFKVDVNPNSMINTFAEPFPEKNSIVRGLWLKDYHLI
jgi:lipopolysaccharide transport system ATP-binding protein